jgi:hypothetical protein
MVQKSIALSEGSRVQVKVPSHHLSCKSSTTLQLFKQSTPLLQTVDCRKVWDKQLTGTEQGSTHCLVWNSHKCPANTATKLEKYKQETKYRCMQRHLPTANPVKAVPPFSSSNNWLHSCRLSIAEKRGANNQQEQSKAPLTVWYMKFTQVPSQYSKRIGEIDNQSMGACKGAFLPPILWKQCHPSALQTINCTPADYQLQKNVGQTTNRNRARLHSLFGMKFTQVPAKNTATDLQNKPCRPTIQLPFTW